MSDREVSEQEIDNRLEELLEIPEDKEFEHLTHTIKFLALIMFNMRKDYLELYKDYAEFKELIMNVVKPKEVLKEKIGNNDFKTSYI